MEASTCGRQQAIELDINGYLLKDSGAREVIDAVHAVAKGDKYFSPAVAALLMNRAQASRQLEEEVEGLAKVTPTERKVLQLIASDRTSKEIAAEFGVSVRTVEGHRASISKKLGLAGTHSLVKFAFEHREEL